jgi:hypothetical protein
MTSEAFEQQLLALVHREPFSPFLVELENGRRIAIDRPAVAINNGGAGFLSDADGLVDFSCDEVRRIALLTGEEITA